ncbi:uncharacterized protein BJX67DRAFT_351061 [Aspergillus lucknowensis]|uniref:Uncharacterized protein n=1 Tax=Aspergillus lucknowensis TaxID=176173 RepID=A0ABR4LXL7_9EURO
MASNNDNPPANATGSATSNPHHVLYKELGIPFIDRSTTPPDPKIYPFGVKVLLPQVINERIFEYAMGGTVDEGNHPTPPPIESMDGRLVNHAWNTHIEPYVHNNWSFDGDPNKIERLWDFLEMVVTQPKRAERLQHLSITTVNLYTEFDPQDIRSVFLTTYRYGDRYFRQKRCAAQQYNVPTANSSDDEIFAWLSLEYLEPDGNIKAKYRTRIKEWYHRALYMKNKLWINQALRDVGFDQGAANGTQDLQTRAAKVLQKGKSLEGYQCPLAALILAYCPNLTGLFIHVWPVPDDPWLCRIVDYAVGRQTNLFQLDELPLHSLKKLRATAKVCRWRRGMVEAGEPFYMDEASLPFHRLPNVQELTLYHVTVGDSVGQMQFTEGDNRPVQQLLLHGPTARDLQLPSLLRISPGLRQLSLGIPGSGYSLSPAPGAQQRLMMMTGLGPNEDLGPSFFSMLWPMLRHFKDQLEYLDLYQDGISRLMYHRWYVTNPWQPPVCPPLDEFLRLRQLNIPILVLAGHNCFHSPEWKLRSHLPPNIETLALYWENSELIKKYIAEGESELLGIVEQGSRNRGGQLRCFIIDEESAQFSRYSTAPSCDRVEQEAIAKGIQFHRDGENILFYAGRQHDIGFSVRDDGEIMQRQKARARQEEDVIPDGLVVLGTAGHLRDLRVAPASAAVSPRPQSPQVQPGDGEGEGEEMDVGE